MSVLEIVKRKLGDNPPDDDILKSDIKEVGQTIKNYLNREDIPEELEYVHANMVIDFIKDLNGENNNSVASIKEGDVTVQFGKGKTRDIVAEELIYNYSSQLNKFRKLRW